MTAEPSPQVFDRRARERFQFVRPAVLRFGDMVLDVTLEDLTRDGCRIACEAELPPYAAVSIGLAGVGHTPGRLVWRSPTTYGCAFDRPLPPGAVTAVTLNNVASLLPAAETPRLIGSDEAKYPPWLRITTIASISIVLWSAIVGAVLVAI